MIGLAAILLATLIGPKDNFLVGRYVIDCSSDYSKLSLNSDHTFAFRVQSCFSHYDNSGTWKYADGVIRLTPKHPDTSGQLETCVIPIKWGDRQYLVDMNQVAAFAAYARDPKLYSEPLSSLDFVRLPTAPASKLNSLRPKLPPGYDFFYAHGETVCQILRFLGKNSILLDRGSESGLHPGMVLSNVATITQFISGGADLKIVSVTATTAVCETQYPDPRGSQLLDASDMFTTGNAMSRPLPFGATLSAQRLASDRRIALAFDRPKPARRPIPVSP